MKNGWNKTMNKCDQSGISLVKQDLVWIVKFFKDLNFG